MELSYSADVSNQFIANIGLVTTKGPNGHNIMACEWTHHVSYNPGLIAVSINPRHATHEYIKRSKEFGVCITSSEQSVLSSVAGRKSGRDFDKIKVLEELGFTFSKARLIDVVLVNQASAQIECVLKEEISLGDHTMFIGEVVAATADLNHPPLIFHQGKYWLLNTQASKPNDAMREHIQTLFEKNKWTS